MSISEDNAMTAMCLWEAITDALDDRHLNPELIAVYEAEGAWAVRSALVHLAPKVDKLWDSLGDDLQDDVGAFDWEFCPLLIDMMHDLHTLPTKAEIKAHLQAIKG